MDQPRPWKTDDELERETSGGRGPVSFRMSMRPAAPPKPQATYGLLIAIAAVFMLEWVTLLAGDLIAFEKVWTIYTETTWYDWIYRPWSPITATLAHHPYAISHILFNALALYVFGPMIESVLGRNKFLVFFFLTGALSSIAQASIDHLWDPPGGPALGASGALMALTGVAIVINPKGRIMLLFPPIPIRLWLAGLIFAGIDLLGAFSGSSGVGNFAHLSGLAIGLAYGFQVRQDMRARGLRFATQ